MTNWAVSAQDARAHKPTHSSRSGTLVSGTVTNVYGSIVQLVASTSCDIMGFWFVAHVITDNYSNPDVSDVVVMIGGSGSEVEIGNFVLYSHSTQDSEHTEFFVPCHLPAGTRISAKCRDRFSGYAGMRISIHEQPCTNWGDSGHGRYEDTTHVNITPSGTADTWGSYGQLIASTSFDADFVQPFIWINDSTMASAYNRFEIAVGGSGSEQPLFEFNTRIHTSSNRFSPLWIPVLPIDIPAGSRLAVRTKRSISATAEDVNVYCRLAT